MLLAAWLIVIVIVGASVACLLRIFRQARQTMQSRRRRNALRRWLQDATSPVPEVDWSPVNASRGLFDKVEPAHCETHAFAYAYHDAMANDEG